MEANGQRLVALALLMASVSCAGGGNQSPGKAAVPVAPKLIRGHYAFGHEVRALRPCDADEDLWVIDRGGLLRQLHEDLTGSVQADRRIFVIVTGSTDPPPPDGFGADYAGAVVIDRVVHAAFEGFGCELDLDGFTFRASGNEPFWTVDVAAGGMRLRRPGHPDRTWPAWSEEREGEVVLLRGNDAGAPGVLSLEPGECRDSMSGAWYPYRASLDLGQAVLEGCALPGTADRP